MHSSHSNITPNVLTENDEMKSKIDMTRLSASPAAWYYVGREVDFSAKPKPISPWGKPLMVYKRGDEIVVQNRHCVHMNTDLLNATPMPNGVACPMHGWKFDLEGRCIDIPGGDHQACQLHLPTYPVHRIGTHLFVHKRAKSPRSSQPLPPFPQFQDKSWSDFELDKGLDFYCDSPWYLITANGFDICHFEFVHGRKPIVPSDIIFHDEYHCGIEHHYRNISQTWFDKLLRSIYGAEMSLSFNVFDGTMILSRTGLNNKSNYMCANVQPIDENTSKITIIPLTLKTLSERQNPLLKILIRWIRRISIRQFFNAELRSIRHVRLNPKRLMPSDHVLIRYFYWLSNCMHKSNTQGTQP